MAEFKLVINDLKTGKSYSRVVKDQNAQFFIGKKIKDKIKGEAVDMPGYEFEITGGSDYCGFPMRWDVDGAQRRKIFAVGGVGIRKKGKGVKMKDKHTKLRKTVAGNTVFDKTAQINLKILKEGPQKLVSEEKKEETKK